MNFLPFYLPLIKQHELLKTVSLDRIGITNNRKVIAFGLGIAIGIHLPIELVPVHEADLKFAREYRSKIEDSIATFNEFMLMDRQLALDVAKAIYMYRSVVANSNSLTNQWVSFGSTLTDFVTDADKSFYDENSVHIDKYAVAFKNVFQQRLKEQEAEASNDISKGY